MTSRRENACIGVSGVGFVVALGFFFYWLASINFTTYLMVSLLKERGLDVDEQTPVEFDLSIGFLHLPSPLAVAHDGGHVTISYAGIKLAEGPVSKFSVAGGPEWVEATRAVASAGKDQAPLSQCLRDQVWADQQVDGEAEFETSR